MSRWLIFSVIFLLPPFHIFLLLNSHTAEQRGLYTRIYTCVAHSTNTGRNFHSKLKTFSLFFSVISLTVSSSHAIYVFFLTSFFAVCSKFQFNIYKFLHFNTDNETLSSSFFSFIPIFVRDLLMFLYNTWNDDILMMIIWYNIKSKTRGDFCVLRGLYFIALKWRLDFKKGRNWIWVHKI